MHAVFALNSLQSRKGWGGSCRLPAVSPAPSCWMSLFQGRPPTAPRPVCPCPASLSTPREPPTCAGVAYDRGDGKFRVRISISNKRIFLGK